ncbi:acyl-CoA reductase [Ramlibacter algicola]|uniref:Acyl-CoA reductase n=1 Tax=Ramlibacter algicola TaxID=2795217 RepID=A0A934Q302_9BURK|nr:acyl-CoA reductase [Ramlibacter algicola]MBK0394110.1 acyl-CoA reductase [Ramlibacter algicola]
MSDVLRFRAGHVPGLDAAQLRWQVLPFSAHGQRLEVEVPALDEVQLAAVAAHVERAAREQLQSLRVDEIVGVVAKAAARLLDPQDPLRGQADELLPIVTGLDPEMVRLALTGYLHAFRAPQLQRFVAEDFANPKMLDGFQPATKGGAVRAVGPSLLVHSWAGNVPGLSMWSFVAGLLVKAGNVGKLASAEPVFATLFAQALVDVRPAWRDAFAVLWWKGGDPVAQVLYREAEVVLGYGGNASLRELREQVPVTTRFLAYGHKVGVALVGREALDRQRGPAAARLAAHDVARYEQQGCYSPHVVYVEAGGAVSPREFAQHLAAELAAQARRHPRRALDLGEAAALASWRQSIEWQGRAELLAHDEVHWAVAFVDGAQPLAPAPGQRCVVVSAVKSLEDVPGLLAPHASVLQTAALATDTDRLYALADALGAAGVTRVCALGSMTQPEAGWHHDGRFTLADLVRMVEIEQGAERAAERVGPHWQEGTP